MPYEYDNEIEDDKIPPGATHVRFWSQSGDIANAPEHESELLDLALPVFRHGDDKPNVVNRKLFREELFDHMWETVRPDTWVEFTDADGRIVINDKDAT